MPRWRHWFQRIAWFEPLWILALGIPLLLPPRFLPASIQTHLVYWRSGAVILLAFGALIRWLAYHKLTRRTPLDWPLLFIIVWLPVAFWASTDKSLSWEAVSPLIVGLAMYLALINWPPTQHRPQIIAWLILLLGVGLAFMAPLFSDLSFGKLFSIPAVEVLRQQLAAQVSGNVNANLIGGALALILPLAVALAARRWSPRRWPQVLCGLAALFMLAMLVLTQSRGAYVAAALGTLMVFVLRWPKLLYALPVVLLAGVVVVYLTGPRAVLEVVASSGSLNSLDERLETWSRALYALNDFPFTGIGIGTWNRVIPILYPLFTIGPDAALNHAHNLLLQVGLDLGIPGLIAYMALYINTFVMLAKAIRRRATVLDWVLAAGTTGGLVAMFVHGIFDAPLWVGKTAFLPWLLVALAIQVGLRAELS